MSNITNKIPDENSESSIKFDYTQFNKFQTYFYTNATMFNTYTDFEIRNNAVMLLTTMGKAFPDLARKILDAYCPTGFQAIKSPAVIKALQKAKFVTGFGNPRIPKEIFYKQLKSKPIPKKKGVKKKTIKGEEFTDDIKAELQSIFMYDSKDFEAFKFTKKIQEMGKMLIDKKGYKIIS